MTTVEIAELFQAKPTGRGRFTALCPVHDDKTPSLSIAEGRNGGVVVHCFAGCSVEQVLATLGLSKRDLFADSQPLTMAQWQEKNLKKLSADAWAEAYRVVSREHFDRERKLWLEMNSLAIQLAHLPQNDPKEAAITAQFHHACAAFRWAEARSLELTRRGIPKFGVPSVPASGGRQLVAA